jgi:hypothetical protein
MIFAVVGYNIVNIKDEIRSKYQSALEGRDTWIDRFGNVRLMKTDEKVVHTYVNNRPVVVVRNRLKGDRIILDEIEDSLNRQETKRKQMAIKYNEPAYRIGFEFDCHKHDPIVGYRFKDLNNGKIYIARERFRSLNPLLVDVQTGIPIYERKGYKGNWGSPKWNKEEINEWKWYWDEGCCKRYPYSGNYCNPIKEVEENVY